MIAYLIACLIVQSVWLAGWLAGLQLAYTKKSSIILHMQVRALGVMTRGR